MFYLIAEFHEQYLHLINCPVLSNTYSIYKKKKKMDLTNLLRTFQGHLPCIFESILL